MDKEGATAGTAARGVKASTALGFQVFLRAYIVTFFFFFGGGGGGGPWYISSIIDTQTLC